VGDHSGDETLPRPPGASEKLDRQVFEKNRSVQLLIDPENGRIVDANPAACRYYGYNRDELRALRITDINTLPPAEVKQCLTRAEAEPESTFQFRHRLASGELREVEVHTGPVEVAGSTLLYSVIYDVTERRRAEAQAGRALSLLHSTLESTTDGILAIDREGHIICCNQRFGQMWSLPADVLSSWDEKRALSHALAQLCDPQGFLSKMRELHRQPETESFDVYELKDGRVFERYSIPQWLGGEPVGRVWSFRDVTARRRTEHALRQSEEKYRAIVQSLEEGYYEVDLGGRFTFVNDALCRALGYGRDEILGLHYRHYTDIENSRKLVEGFGRVYATGRSVLHLDWQIRRRDGTPLDISASVALLREPDGRPMGFRGLVRDFTERKRAEEALRQSEERYRRLVELCPDAIAIHSDGRLVFANRAGVRLVGARSVEEILGRSVMEFVHPDARLLAARRVRELAEGRDAPLVEEKFVRVDGSAVDVEVAAMPFNHDGRQAALVVMRDISERKRAERLQSALYRLAEASSSAAELTAFYATIHVIVSDLMEARNFQIALHEPESDQLSFPYHVDERASRPAPAPLARSRGLPAYVLRTGRSLLCSPAVLTALRESGEVDGAGPPLEWLGVPLKRGSSSFGVLAVQSYGEAAAFSPADRELLSFVSQHVATAIDRRRAAEALRESETQFRTLAETVPCAIFIYQGTRFRYANAAMASLTGYSREELTAVSFWRLAHPEFRDMVRARQRQEPGPVHYELKFLRKDGQERWVDFQASFVEYGGQPAALGTAFDVTERKQAEEQIKHIAYQDALTGLPNRRLFSDRLQMAVAQAHRLGQRLAVLFLDLDRFKVINDSLGHTIGDQLLQAVAERLLASVREGDTVARLGGDEFTLIFPGMARAVDVAKVADKILEALRQPFRLGERELFVTGSIGISLYPEDGDDPEALVKNADTAMYRAKDQGRDTYQLYTRAMNATALERLAMENSLRRALAHNELLLHYQPLLDLETGRVPCVEALLRWRHPELGLVPPSEFIPLAELTGLIFPISPWVLRTACAQVKAWHERGHTNLSVSVNLTARQFQQPDLVAQVTRVLEESGLPARFLDLELTESNAMQNAEATVEILRQLKALGVRISIDDFGTGYSSLSYLRRLPIDTLKIDQSFVRDITTDPDDAAIVTAVLAMARSLKLAVVAEGVESEEQLAFLAARSCDRMQGYLFSRPLPADECMELLDRHHKP
jgi:diguanylate cyclase (GGDEF)-like protein/PAS domain S-box-containing protein